MCSDCGTNAFCGFLRVIPPSRVPARSLVVNHGGMKSEQIIHSWLVKKLHGMTKVWQGKLELWDPALRLKRNQPV